MRLSHIKWTRNGQRLVDEPLPPPSSSDHTGVVKEFDIEKKAHHDHVLTTLHIKHATLADAGTYVCKFGAHLSEKIHVDVIATGDEKPKSSGILRRSFLEILILR